MLQILKDFWQILKESFIAWKDDDPFRLSAVIAYYAVFSLPALMYIIITVTGFFLGEKAVEGEVSSEIADMVGEKAARTVEVMIANAKEERTSVLQMVISFLMLFFAATTVFIQLQKALNEIWEVTTRESGGIKKLVIDRLQSFGVIIVAGLLLLISLLITTSISILNDWISQILPNWFADLIFVLDFVISYAIITFLFALIFKVLPDVKIKWKPAVVGASVTTLLFIIGKFGLAIYFGNTNPASPFGAAGSLILILLWISYSSMIIFLGAKFTYFYARHYGHPVEPSAHAVRFKKQIIKQDE